MTDKQFVKLKNALRTVNDTLRHAVLKEGEYDALCMVALDLHIVIKQVQERYDRLEAISAGEVA